MTQCIKQHERNGSPTQHLRSSMRVILSVLCVCAGYEVVGRIIHFISVNVTDNNIRMNHLWSVFEQSDYPVLLIVGFVVTVLNMLSDIVGMLRIKPIDIDVFVPRSDKPALRAMFFAELFALASTTECCLLCPGFLMVCPLFFAAFSTSVRDVESALLSRAAYCASFLTGKVEDVSHRLRYHFRCQPSDTRIHLLSFGAPKAPIAGITQSPCYMWSFPTAIFTYAKHRRLISTQIPSIARITQPARTRRTLLSALLADDFLFWHVSPDKTEAPSGGGAVVRQHPLNPWEPRKNRLVGYVA